MDKKDDLDYLREKLSEKIGTDMSTGLDAAMNNDSELYSMSESELKSLARQWGISARSSYTYDDEDEMGYPLDEDDWESDYDEDEFEDDDEDELEEDDDDGYYFDWGDEDDEDEDDDRENDDWDDDDWDDDNWDDD